MSLSPSRHTLRRVSSRIKDKYPEDESTDNIEAVLEVSSSYDDNDKPLHRPSPLRRIFSNPAAPVVRRSSVETSLLHDDVEEKIVHHSNHIPEETTKRKGGSSISTSYGLRRIFSNPHGGVDTGVPLTKTKSYHHPRSYDEKDELNKPFSLVRRASRRHEKQEDDETVDESVEVSVSSSTKSVRKSKKKKWALLFTVLGLAGVGGYCGYTFLSHNDKKSKKKRIHANSLQSFGDNSESFDVNGGQDDMIQDASSQGSSLFIADAILPPTSPTYSPTYSPPTDNPMAPPTLDPTSKPTQRPTRKPSNRPTPNPTEDTTLTFYVMADAPYSDYERDEVMPDVIDTLPEDAEFLFHLGDLEYKKQDNCEEWAYKAASRALKKSKVPVFVLPGDNDLNDCDDHDAAEENWSYYFGYMDELWNHTLSVTRWGALDESFSFLRNRILFFGINVVGGTPYSNSEKEERHQEHLHQLKSIMNDRRWEYDVVVLLGHAEPKDRHADLFEGDDGLASFVEQMRKPFLHIHGDWHNWYESEGSFGVDNYLRISLDSLIREDKEVAVPVRVEIDSSKRYGAIKIDRGRTGWDVDCCSGNGWPRPPRDDDDYYYYSSEDR